MPKLKSVLMVAIDNKTIMMMVTEAVIEKKEKYHTIYPITLSLIYNYFYKRSYIIVIIIIIIIELQIHRQRLPLRVLFYITTE